MDISKLNVVELKALAFDTLQKLSALNADLQLLNKRIKQMEEYKTPEEVEATPVETEEVTTEETPVEETTE